MKVMVCNTPMEYPAELGELRDCNGLLGDPAALHERMREDGYLLVRGMHPRSQVAAARKRFIHELEQRGDGAYRDIQEVAAQDEIRAVLESPRLFAFFADYFGEPALTFDEKWLRAVPAGGFTGLHYDNVYMGRGSKRLHTVWTPLGDLNMQLGTLAVCVGSHTSQFQRLQETYGSIDVDRTHIVGAGWYSNDPLEATEKFGGHWCTTDVQMGDVIILGMFTLHASTRNETDQLRLSCDIRYQPAADPVDERWHGPDRTGHGGNERPANTITLAQAKAEWGI